MLRIAAAFIKKDYLTDVSYRLNFVVKIGFIFLAVALLYYFGKFADSASIPILQEYGGSYFGFLLIGVTFMDYVAVSINTFAQNIREGQLTGTLEVILSSPTPLFTFLISSSLWGYILTSFRIFLYLFVGAVVFGLDMGQTNILAALTIFMLSIVTYIATGIIFAALVLVVKKGESVFNAFGSLIMILSGVFFPVEIFPPWIAKVALLIPFTYSLRGLRLSILGGQSVSQIVGDVIALSIFAITFLGMSLILFPYALKKAKIDGSLTQY